MYHIIYNKTLFYQKLLELEDVSEDERKELLSKIDSLESIVRMLELKTKNSHDHGTDVNGTSSLPIYSSFYSGVDYFFYLYYALFICIYIHIIVFRTYCIHMHIYTYFLYVRNMGFKLFIYFYKIFFYYSLLFDIHLLCYGVHDKKLFFSPLN